MNNSHLSAAKGKEDDEWYTQLSDIQEELNYYTDKFENKVVFCNCDDPFESNFVKFFLLSFNRLRLKKLIATGYKTSPIGGTEIGVPHSPYVLQVSSTKEYLVGTQTDLDMEGARHFLEVEGNHLITNLKGDTQHEPGDFRSQESIDLLKESDIVCTNPPYSLLREYVQQLQEYNKEFLIIINQNALTYKEIFPSIQNNKWWLGASSCVRWFIVSPSIKKKTKLNSIGQTVAEGARSRWLTNIDHIKRHQMRPVDLGYKYKNHEEMYPKYDNYNAIEIGKLLPSGKWIGDADLIPYDYTGEMGVPITFLDNYCPEQFEIVGSFNASSIAEKGNHGYVMSTDTPTIISGKEKMWNGPVLNKQPLFKRVVIKYTKSYIQNHPDQFNNGGE